MTKPILSFLFSILLIGQPVVAQQAQWQWSGIEKVVSVADIHGAYDAFVTILGKSDLIDEQLNWSGDTAHLVIVGDVLDRGADSRKALELIMKLEEQAETAGGRVHMVLGNHEVMNLIGDLNYVSDDEYAAYIENEDSSMRSEINQEDMPPGFYGHRKLFSNTGTFGQWLLNKPVLLKVNDTIFTHGGISSDVLETSAAEINASYASELRDYVTNINQLAAQGFLPLETDFYDHGNYLNVVIKKHQADGIEIEPATLQVMNETIALNQSPLFAGRSPIWYRGNVGCNAVLEESRIEQLLSHLAVNHIVVGHTPTSSHEVLTRFGDRVIRTDTGMLASHYKGKASALIITGDKMSVVYQDSDMSSEPVDQARQIGVRPGSISDSALEEILKNNEILGEEKLGKGSFLLKMKHEDTEFDVLFMPAVSKRKGKIFIPEVAAYRLDKLLGMEMVPVTVMREYDGVPGAVQIKPSYMINEQTRIEKRQGGGATCPLPDQFNLMYVFDSLIYNEGRTQDEMRYTSSNWHLTLTGNRKILANKKDLPRYLREVELNIPSVLKTKLHNLNQEQLSEILGDVLDAKRIEGILKRRDAILGTAG